MRCNGLSVEYMLTLVVDCVGAELVDVFEQ